ncbi:HAMP domain-containing sensor histidine kinase [Polyangium sp. 15x6]|uniref:sensor histidine kinase n=1 Tax=Polyangium sp. 15x6 TaxID=3042687 RepID=UPI00249B7EA9|nr:HAMP domain-containing sensor histidine kinase [Polyangium sp. 15x6]MDI3284516.1 HAMP domain-containing sensor histidine kinase [Polyangium sp. 15x6]
MKMRTEFRLLLAAVIIMMFGVIASLAVFKRASRSLAEAHEVIAGNAAPTVVALDVAQARLRKLHELVLSRLLDAPGDTALRDASIAAAERELDRAIDDYQALPRDPGEAPLQRAVTESLEQVNRVVSRSLALEPAAFEASGLRRELDAAMTQLSRDLVRASEFSASIASAAADEVARTSTRLLPIEFFIEGITFVAAVLTLTLTYRAVQRARAVAAESVAALERRADELESFSGRVAHDLLSPLATVSLALDMASRRLTEPADASTRKAVTRASQTLQRVRSFVSDLLEFARAGATPLPGVRARIDDVVSEIAEEFGPVAQDAGVELRVEAITTDRRVACSPGVLMSVLSNLVQNAIKYMGDGEERRITIRSVDRDDEVRVEVQDTGPGIAPSDRDGLFELYARGHDAKTPGLGLGLATVKRLVESHGGHVGVETAPGRGSVFWFSMPAAAPS